MSAIFSLDQVLAWTESATSEYSTTSQCLSARLGRPGRVKFILDGLRWKKKNNAPITPIQLLPGDSAPLGVIYFRRPNLSTNFVESWDQKKRSQSEIKISRRLHRVRETLITCALHSQNMGKKQGAVAGDGLNRKRMSSNKKHNWERKCNRKNIIEKQMKSPARILTSKPMYVHICSVTHECLLRRCATMHAAHECLLRYCTPIHACTQASMALCMQLTPDSQLIQKAA